jgi:hypothetical protein
MDVSMVRETDGGVYPEEVDRRIEVRIGTRRLRDPSDHRERYKEAKGTRPGFLWLLNDFLA